MAGTALVSLLTEPEIAGAFRLAEKREAACRGGMRQNSHCVERVGVEGACGCRMAVSAARTPFCQVGVIKGVVMHHPQLLSQFPSSGWQHERGLRKRVQFTSRQDQPRVMLDNIQRRAWGACT